MKNWFYLIACLGCFSLFFTLGRSETPPHKFPLKEKGAPRAFHTPHESAVIAQDRSGAFPNETPGVATGSELPGSSTLLKRFASPYPQSNQKFGPREQETVARLSLLKALARTQQPAFALYKQILANPGESWVVKRQALRNALALSPSLPEQDRDRLIASVPHGLLLQAGKTEQELIQEYLIHARRE